MRFLTRAGPEIGVASTKAFTTQLAVLVLLTMTLAKIRGRLAAERETALVHEAYLRLVEQHHQNWESRSHFFGVAAHLMRLILVDWARKSRAGKRGAGVRPVPLEELTEAEAQRPERLIALDDALTDLAAFDARKVQIIERRYFGGMTVQEVAQSLGISDTTVERETRNAQLWLFQHMKGGDPA